MRERLEDDCDELDLKTFNKTFLELAKKPGNKYDFIVKAGSSFRKALFTLMSIIWKTENLPEEWLESTIIQLKKWKRLENDLDDICHIHDRNIYSN